MNDKQKLDIFIVELEEIVKNLKARQRLDSGFRGMGANILMEKACNVDGAIFKLQRLIKKFDAKL